MGTAFTPAMAQRIELWPVERLVPFENNARTHSPEQLAQLQASIEQFGFTAPILVDGQDGILAGHGRLEAARLLGMTEVPVVVLDHMSPEQRRAYVIADNKLAENAGWDLGQLNAELRALMAADFDLNSMGFDDDELKRLEDGLELGEFEELSQGFERAEPEQQPGLGMMPGAGEDDDEEVEEEEDDTFQRGQPLAIILEPEEMRVWRQAKEKIGYVRDKAALLKLANDYLNPPEAAQQ